MDSHSAEYRRILTQAEIEWPQWKVDFYNNHIAVSAHARKIVSKSDRKEGKSWKT